MAHLFWDTSALVRRYALSEPGAARVRATIAREAGHRHLISRLATVEMASALALKVRAGDLALKERDSAWRLFRRHLQRDYSMVELSDQVWRTAQELLFRHALRAADAVHLAAALSLRAEIGLVMWTADRRQAVAALDEGLSVEVVS